MNDFVDNFGKRYRWYILRRLQNLKTSPNYFWSYWANGKTKWEIISNFVAFSENLNFMKKSYVAILINVQSGSLDWMHNLKLKLEWNLLVLLPADWMQGLIWATMKLAIFWNGVDLNWYIKSECYFVLPRIL